MSEKNISTFGIMLTDEEAGDPETYQIFQNILFWETSLLLAFEHLPGLLRKVGCPEEQVDVIEKKMDTTILSQIQPWIREALNQRK